MMKTSTVCLLATLATLVLLQTVTASYTDCAVECMLQALKLTSKPTYCRCDNSVKKHWGKRTPSGFRIRAPARVPFRYGKRESPFINQGVESEYDDSRLDTLRMLSSLRDQQYD